MPDATAQQQQQPQTQQPPAPQLMDNPPDMPQVQGVHSLQDLFSEVTDQYVNPVTDVTEILKKLPSEPQQSDQSVAPDATAATPAPAPPPTDWESRYKNLQSYYDEQRVHWDKMQQSLGSSDPTDVAQAMAIRQAIVSDPELFGVVTTKLSTGQPLAPHTQTQVAPPPPRPANFDPEDVYTPGTPSYQWMQQMDDYKQQQLVSKVTSAVDTRLNAITQQQQQELQRRQLEEARRNVRQHASATFQGDPREADRFVGFVERGPAALGLPQQLDLEYLTAIYKTLVQTMQQRGIAPNGLPPVTAASQQDVVAARLAALKNQTAPPVTSVTQVPGEPENLSPGDDFLAGIKAASAKRFSIL